MKDSASIHSAAIAKIKKRVDIVSIISQYVTLTPRGKDLVGKCPLRPEDHSGFTVSPRYQVYFCFGCNCGGDVVNFLKLVKKQSLTQTVLELLGD